jgi:hypothetical protein
VSTSETSGPGLSGDEEWKSESPLLAFFRRKKPTQPATCGSLDVDSDSGVNGVPTRSVASKGDGRSEYRVLSDKTKGGTVYN